MMPIKQAEPLRQVRQMADNLLTKFNDIDQDRDGYLSRADLSSYKQSIEKGWYKLSEKFEVSDMSTVAQIEVVEANLKQLSNVSNDQWGPETRGLSRQDLSKLLQQTKSAERPSDVLVNMDAFLTEHELKLRHLFEQVGKTREYDRNLILTAPGGVGQYPDPSREIHKEPVEMPNPADRLKERLIGC